MLSGLLPSPDVTMSMMGITFNIHALCFFAAHGLSGAASTRIGNDLGAGRPRMAWLTTQVWCWLWGCPGASGGRGLCCCAMQAHLRAHHWHLLMHCPQTYRTLQVGVLLGTLVMAVSGAVLLLGRHQLGALFSSDEGVILLTAQAVPPLAVSLVGEGANTVLSGIMRGCGRQKIGATVNLVRV